jgi:uncharacterized protein YqgC (DUF456 family)
MWLLLIAIGVFGLCYIFYKILPLTVLAIVIMVGVIAYISFGEHQQASDTVTTTGAAIIIIAFVVDVLMKFAGLFRGMSRPRDRDTHTRSRGQDASDNSSVDDKALRRNIRR